MGLADGFKGIPPIALLPIGPTSVEEEWASRQYLGLYPRIRYGKLEGHASEVWKVWDPRDGKNWTLEKWLQSTL